MTDTGIHDSKTESHHFEIVWICSFLLSFVDYFSGIWEHPAVTKDQFEAAPLRPLEILEMYGKLLGARVGSRYVEGRWGFP